MHMLVASFGCQRTLGRLARALGSASVSLVDGYGGDRVACPCVPAAQRGETGKHLFAPGPELNKAVGISKHRHATRERTQRYRTDISERSHRHKCTHRCDTRSVINDNVTQRGRGTKSETPRGEIGKMTRGQKNA